MAQEATLGGPRTHGLILAMLDHPLLIFLLFNDESIQCGPQELHRGDTLGKSTQHVGSDVDNASVHL